MKIKYAAISETGRRGNNEDYFKVVEMPESNRLLAIVCDGMGGHACGEVASETVGNAISKYWQENAHAADNEEKVRAACREASGAMLRKSEELELPEMGTTMVMASIEGDRLTVAHVGDSRCYLLRPGEGLLYLTEDHVALSFGWEVVTRCFFSTHPEDAVPDIRQFDLQAGDRILLCSDGLHKSVEADSLPEFMMEDKALEDILHGFDILCRKYGDDNYTAVLMEIES